MERLTHNFHARLQEMCDCYLNSDLLAELERPPASAGGDLEEEALRYLALLLLYTVTMKARQLAVKVKAETVKISVDTEHEKTTVMPVPPPTAIAAKIFAIVRAITQIDAERGETSLALGIRNEPIEMRVKVKREEGKESVKFLLPEL